MADKRYCVNAPAVVSEIIDGEVVLMNLQVGHYYSSAKVGAILWHWIEAGRSLPEIIDLVQQHYTGNPDVIQDAVTAFITTLLEHELITTPAGNTQLAPSQPATPDFLPALRLPFEAPTLQVYSDMQDLLLLDPIHDVSEAGWPAARKETPAR